MRDDVCVVSNDVVGDADGEGLRGVVGASSGVEKRRCCSLGGVFGWCACDLLVTKRASVCWHPAATGGFRCIRTACRCRVPPSSSLVPPPSWVKALATFRWGGGVRKPVCCLCDPAGSSNERWPLWSRLFFDRAASRTCIVPRGHNKLTPPKKQGRAGMSETTTKTGEKEPTKASSL